MIIEIILTVVATGATLTIPVIVEKLSEALFGIFRLAWKNSVKIARTFSKFDIKSVDDVIKGFQEFLNFLKKGWDEIRNIIDDAFEKIKKFRNKEPNKIRSNYFNSVSDPVADILGAASKSHPVRLKQIISDLTSKDVEIIFRSDEALGYSPGLSKGKPSQIIIPPLPHESFLVAF